MSSDLGMGFGFQRGPVSHPVRPVWWMLLLASGLTIAGAVFSIPQARWADVVGYVCGSLGLLGLVAFRFANRVRQMDRNYVPDSRVGPVVILTISVALVVVVINAYGLAQRVPV